jgi:hypothetical protein
MQHTLSQSSKVSLIVSDRVGVTTGMDSFSFQIGVYVFFIGSVAITGVPPNYLISIQGNMRKTFAAT